MPDSIQNVEDLKNAYPELCGKIFEEGIYHAVQVAQNFFQERIEKSLETITTLQLQFHKDVSTAVVRSFIYDLAELKEDPQFLKWLAESGIDLADFNISDLNINDLN